MTTDSVVPTPSTRAATDADVAFIVETSAAAAAVLRDGRGANLMLEREMPAPDATTVATWMHDGASVVLVGALDDAPVGVGAARVDVLTGGTRLAVITMLWVDEAARGVGVGEALLNALIDWARTQQCNSIDAYALPGERVTKNFFEAAGMKARLLTVGRSLHDDAS